MNKVFNTSLLWLLIGLASCQQYKAQHNSNTMNNSEKQHYTNRLIHETSPYLLQHAHNPVDWYPWGDEAFEKAQKENKLVLVSIGYAACHWCHVMEHESFENEEVAILMNEKYVCVKVDREERPDVDQIYMTAVQMITGSGGWPLNCFVLPDRRPIYGGTYFRPNDWKNVLIGLDATHKTEPEKIEKAANEISHGIVQSNLIEANSGEHVFLKEDIRPSIDAWEKQFDELWGGTDGAPKFPMPSGLEFLQSYAFYHNDPVVESHFMHTLNKIAYGGIYDQVGGGFARYSVDAEWKAPHFEKMLYDNAQLLSVYAKAYQQNPEVLYEKTILQTIAFLEREMYAKGTAFYASYDADSEGVEGKFYVWTELELKNILKTSEYWVLDYYNVRPEGNWEGHNILWITQHEEMLHELNIDEQTFYKKLEAVNAKIIKEREKRIYPGLDNKILTEWNALLGIAYLDVFLALGDEKYLNQAKALASFYQQSVIQESGMVYRNYTNGKANIEGVLNDYALLTRFYIKLYQHTVNKDYLVLSLRLLNYVETHFFDAQSQLFFYTNVNAKDLITRSIEISDNVIPSSNAVMAHNLLDLSIILGETRYREMSEQMLQNVWPKVKSSLPYFSYWASLWLRLSENQYEVVVYGEDADSYLAEMKKAYHPNVFFIGSKSLVENSPLFENRWVEGETLIYVCKDNVCQLPVKSVEEAMKLLKHNF